MKATRSKIVAALWLAGALAGLLAILALPGRWDGSDSAEAHTSVGIKFIDSKSTSTDGHNLCPDDPQKALDEEGVPKGDADACPFVDPPGIPPFGGPWYELSKNYDQDGDGKFDTYLLKSGSHARLVVHVREAFDDAPDGTKVNFDVKEGGLTIIAYSELCGTPFESGSLPPAGLGSRTLVDVGSQRCVNQGSLTFVPGSPPPGKASFVTADTVSDFNAAGPVGPCNDSADTCIDALDGPSGNAKSINPDGIAMINVQCPFHKTKSVVSAKVIIGANTYRDEITILCAGPQVALEIQTLSAKHGKPQSVIATFKAARNEGDKNNGPYKGYGGDPDLLVVVTTVDSGGNPVPKQPVICTIVLETNQSRHQADLKKGLKDNQEFDNGSTTLSYIRDIFNQAQTSPAIFGTPSPFPAGVKVFSVETEPGNKNGTITIRCWVDKNKNRAFDADEINNTTQIRLASQPATLELEGPDKVTAGELVTYTVQVLDKTGEGVANLTNCHWSPVDPSPGTNAVFVGDVDDQEKVDTETQDGKTEAQLFTVGPGSTGITVLCGEAKAARVVQINPAAGVVVTKGDVDKDGVISVFDALAILQDAAGEADVDFPENADVDNDGDVDVLDALATLLIVSGG